MRAEEMVVVDMEGRHVAGSQAVTSEIGMHVAIYRQRPDVDAVVHAHPPIATAFACSGRALDEPLCAEAIMTLGPVPLARYATTGTEEVGESLHDLVAGHEAILMANHGAVTYGKNLLEAFLEDGDARTLCPYLPGDGATGVASPAAAGAGAAPPPGQGEVPTKRKGNGFRGSFDPGTGGR